MQALISLAVMIAIGAVLVTVFLQRMNQMLQGIHESAMTVAMAQGMAAGLTGGVIAGLVAPDDLFLPTVVGTLAGVASGVAAGLQGGLMAVLEGVMSGVMAGTMGAMMGGMMPARGVPLMVGVAGLGAATGVMTAAMLWPKAHPDHGDHGDHGEQGDPGEHGEHGDNGDRGGGIIPRRSLAVIASVTLAAGLAAWFGAGPLVHRLPVTGEHVHVAPVEVTVTAGEYGLTPQVVELPQGKTVRLRLVNQGQQEHDLTVPGLEYRLAARSDRRAEPPGLHLFAGAGDTETLEIVALRPGDYPAFCSMVGHKDLGMTLVIRVTAGQQ